MCGAYLGAYRFCRLQFSIFLRIAREKQPPKVVVGQLSAHTRRIFRKSSCRAGAAAVRLCAAATSSAAACSAAGQACFPRGFLCRPLCEHTASPCMRKSRGNHAEQARNL